MTQSPDLITAQTLISPSPSQVATELDGEAVILNLDNGVYYGLDEIGSHIWSLLQAPRTFAELIDLLLLEYEVERETCELDVQKLLHDMHDHELILLEK